MKRFTGLLALAAVAILVLAPIVAMAQTTSSFETITVSSTAIGITAAVYAPVGLAPRSQCFLTLATDQVRWRIDGVAPTAAVGHLMDVGSTITFTRFDDFKQFRAIRVTSDAALSVTCE